MEIPHTDTGFLHIICQILRHSFGKSCDENFVMVFHFPANLGQQIVDLSFHWPDVHLGIQKTGGPDDLLGPQQFVLRFVFSGVADTNMI